MAELALQAAQLRAAIPLGLLVQAAHAAAHQAVGDADVPLLAQCMEAAGDLGIQGREGLPFVAGEHLHQAIGQRREAAVFSGEWH
jgi:hypothetical protein